MFQVASNSICLAKVSDLKQHQTAVLRYTVELVSLTFCTDIPAIAKDIISRNIWQLLQMAQAAHICSYSAVTLHGSWFSGAPMSKTSSKRCLGKSTCVWTKSWKEIGAHISSTGQCVCSTGQGSIIVIPLSMGKAPKKPPTNSAILRGTLNKS